MSNYEQWYLVVGEGVNNVRMPANDPNHAVEMASKIAGVHPSTLRVYCRGGAFCPISVECWHYYQL